MVAMTNAIDPQRNPLLNMPLNAFPIPLLMLKIRVICENANVANVIVRAVSMALEGS